MDSEALAHTCVGPLASVSAGLFAQLPIVEPDHYIDRVEIARGGMGRIVVARDRRLGHAVAIKELCSDSPALRVRFAREALLTARLRHPSIVHVHEVGLWPGGEPFYAMGLVPGRSLDRVIAAAPMLAIRLALIGHVQAVADALAYAHEHRVIHRDLTPHNVLVGLGGETVVIDWGLAKDLDADEADTTSFGQVLGTPAYMAPEQAAGIPVDERADVYAIGALLYHLLAGVPAYVGSSSVDVVTRVISEDPVPLAIAKPGVPAPLCAIVARAMARDPADRYRDASDLAADLRFYAAPIMTRSPTAC